MPQRSAQRYERYLFDASPWCQNMTQRDLADLLGIEKSTLESLIDHKDEWIRRRTVPINKKLRDLAYPFGRLRQVHERIKYHMDKIKQPDYLQSPRKGHSQRDNALVHTGQNQFLSLDSAVLSIDYQRARLPLGAPYRGVAGRRIWYDYPPCYRRW